MSTDAPARGGRTRRRRRRFLGAFAIIVAVLVAAGLTGAAVSTLQGPRVTAVDVDPQAAITTSGSRLILTTSERMATVDPTQIQVTPAAPFTVDTSGRSIGIRFTLPLEENSDYTVRVLDATGSGGGPSSILATTFHTPVAVAFLLRRAPDGDTIFRTTLDGSAAVPVYRAEHIEDFRATTSHLAISLRGEHDLSSLVVTDLDGQNARQLQLPGEGYVTNLQSAERGDRVGYTYTDSLLAVTGQESALYTVSLRDADAAPTRIAVTGRDDRVVDWRFVPDTDRVLLVSFDGSLLLTDATGGGATLLGTATALDGISRGSLIAVVQRVDGRGTVDLKTGSEGALVDATDVTGTLTRVLPLAGGDGGATVRAYGLVGDGAVSLGTSVVRVAADGTATKLYDVPGSGTVLQLCASPNGQQIAVLVAPDLVSNAYDTYRLPLPGKVATHILDAATGAEVGGLAGFDLSWCQAPPQ